MSATILQFPSASPSPCQLTPEVTGALFALVAERPRWELAFGECDDGDEWVYLCDTLNGRTAVFMVAAMPRGRFGIVRGDVVGAERFTTGAEVVAALRSAGV